MHQRAINIHDESLLPDWLPCIFLRSESLNKKGHWTWCLCPLSCKVLRLPSGSRSFLLHLSPSLLPVFSFFSPGHVIIQQQQPSSLSGSLFLLPLSPTFLPSSLILSRFSSVRCPVKYRVLTFLSQDVLDPSLRALLAPRPPPPPPLWVPGLGTTGTGFFILDYTFSRKISKVLRIGAVLLNQWIKLVVAYFVAFDLLRVFLN